MTGLGSVVKVVAAFAALLMVAQVALLAQRASPTSPRNCDHLPATADLPPRIRYCAGTDHPGGENCLPAPGERPVVGADPDDPNKFTSGFYAQNKQDLLMLQHIFQWGRGGVFVEAGARDGIDFSNTYFMEKHLGWSGLCVEPNPILMEKLMAFTKRKKCVRVPNCLSNESMALDFLAYDSGLAGLADSVDQARVDAQIKERGIKRADITKRIQCRLLTDILLENDIRHVDFLSLDIEGAELSALKGLDFDKISVYALMVENNDLCNNNDVRHYLEGHGYERVLVFGPDEVFVRHDRRLSTEIV